MKWNETHLSVFHSVLNCARRKCSRNSFSSVACYAFNSFFLVSSKRLYDIHVTWFDRFLHRKGDSAALIIIHVFIAAGQIQKETKIKTSLRARGPPGVSGALRSLGRTGSSSHGGFEEEFRDNMLERVLAYWEVLEYNIKPHTACRIARITDMDVHF